MSTTIGITNLNSTYTALKNFAGTIFASDSIVSEAITNPGTASPNMFLTLAETLNNMAFCLETAELYAGLLTLIGEFKNVSGFSLVISSQDDEYLTTRTNAINSMLNSLSAYTWGQTEISNLTLGLPAFTGNDIVEIFSTTIYEVPPTNITTPADIISVSQDEANAWGRIGIAYQAVSSGDSLNALQYMQDMQTLLSNTISDYISPATNVDTTSAWNAIVAVPTIQQVAHAFANQLYGDLTSNIDLFMYMLKQLQIQCNNILYSLRLQPTSTQSTQVLLANESLMDFSNRTTGDFNNWNSIAQNNGLLPPYTQNTPGISVAFPGKQLFVSNSQPTVTTVVPSYEKNFLGVDILLANPGTEMTVWTGDFQTISGYQNLAVSLIRRLQTEQGSLMYHTDYGSLLQSFIGTTMYISSIAMCLSLAKTTLLSDFRVGQVSDINAMVNPQSASQLAILATIIAARGPKQPTSIAAVIQPSVI